jgi:hypothetical protein
MAVLVGNRMRRRQKVGAKGATLRRLVARMSREVRGGHNLKPTIYVPSGVTPKT